MAGTPPDTLSQDAIKVRQVTHYQFGWTAGAGGAAGTWTLQLILDQGAAESVMHIDPDDADNLQDLLTAASVVYFDQSRNALLFGAQSVG